MKLIKIIFFLFFGCISLTSADYTILEFFYVQHKVSSYLYSPIPEVLQFKCPFYISVLKNITKMQFKKRINYEVNNLYDLYLILKENELIRIPSTPNYLLIKLSADNINFFYFDDIRDFDVRNYKTVWVLNGEI